MKMQIILENRFQDDIGNDFLLSVDGTDFQVPFHGRKWYSYKFNGSALRYDVALCIRTGWICWINGPFLPGIWNDLEIFRSELATCLEPNERVEADDGYEAEAPFKVKCPSSMTIAPERKAMMSRVGKRQETVNRRFKQWKILKSVFRHDLTMHCRVFSAIAVITQLAIENGEPLFQVDYDDNLDEE